MPTSRDEFMHKVHKLVYVIDKEAGRVLHEKTSYTFSQFLILMALRRHPRISQDQVACFLQLTPAAVSRQVEGLAKKKLLLQKENKGNRRAYILSLTSLGQKAFSTMLAALEEHFDPSFSKIEEKAYREANKLIDALLFGMGVKGDIVGKK